MAGLYLLILTYNNSKAHTACNTFTRGVCEDGRQLQLVQRHTSELYV